MRGVLLERPTGERAQLVAPRLAVRGPDWLRRLAARLPVDELGALGTHPYANGYLNAFAKKIDWVNDAIKVSLHTSTYAPAQTHKWQNDLTNEVANGNGYTTNGVALGSPTNVVASSTQTLDGADVSWTSSGAGFSAAFAVVYDSTPGTAGTNPLICYVDLGGTQTVAGGAVLSIVWNASGIIACTVS